MQLVAKGGGMGGDGEGSLRVLAKERVVETFGTTPLAATLHYRYPIIQSRAKLSKINYIT